MKSYIGLGLVCVALLLNKSYAGVAIPDCEDFKDDDRISLACNIYWEARNQTTEGMIAVAVVTLNRVKDSRFPGNISDVVWQHKQFSWTIDGKSDKPFKNEQLIWNKAWAISGMFALLNTQKHKLCNSNNNISDSITCQKVDDYYSHIINNILPSMDNTQGSVMYHADYSNPSWSKSKKLSLSKRIGNHIFYVYK